MKKFFASIILAIAGGYFLGAAGAHFGVPFFVIAIPSILWGTYGIPYLLWD